MVKANEIRLTRVIKGGLAPKSQRPTGAAIRNVAIIPKLIHRIGVASDVEHMPRVEKYAVIKSQAVS